MRQAQESEIIRLSMHIREGKPISTFDSLGEQVQIFQPKDVVSGMYTWADQIICATNEKRNYINRFMREQKGYTEEPCIGDKIISLRNHWDDYSFWGEWALTNGTIGTISDFKLQEVYVPKYIADNRINFMFTEIDLENGDSFINVPIDYECLKTGQSTLNSKQQYQMNKNKMIPDAPYEFAYAYAITCWKAQGSEWDKILGIEEAFPFDKDTRQKYMYTLCTRAKEKLVLITK
jgi:exodeoxyribonuclease-5